MRSALLAVVAMIALTGCGADEQPSSQPPAQETATGTSLTITVLSDEGAEPNVMELTCDPVGGGHPNAESACARLAQVGGLTAFEPTPVDRACTMNFGGPQTATITGSYRGDEVDASFSRENGCEIDRWDALGTEVFDVPLQ